MSIWWLLPCVLVAYLWGRSDRKQDRLERAAMWLAYEGIARSSQRTVEARRTLLGDARDQE